MSHADRIHILLVVLLKIDALTFVVWDNEINCIYLVNIGKWDDETSIEPGMVFLQTYNGLVIEQGSEF